MRRKAGAEAFVVIRDAMKRKDKVALARVVLSNREHVIALKSLGKGLLGTTLRYPYELRDEDDYFDDIPSPRVSPVKVPGKFPTARWFGVAKPRRSLSPSRAASDSSP
jgi:non-homologous end joining protein Ku